MPPLAGGWRKGDRVIDAIRISGGRPGSAALVTLIAGSLAACGGAEPDQGETIPPAVQQASTETAEFAEGASPEALDDEADVNAPQNIETITLAIDEGRFNPDRVEAFVDSEYVLQITGDGTEHTLAIPNLITGETIAAEGQTEIAVSISAEPGEYEMTLDGEPAGTFEVQDAAGISE